MLKAFIILGLVVYHASADVIRRSADDDECYRCSTWDALGQGFIEADDNPPQCSHYKECWKAKNTGKIQSIERWCAPGTWTDHDDIRRGAPCTRTTCDPDVCDDCDIPTASTPIVYPCPYHQMTPEWMFGIWLGTHEKKVGTCGPQGYFNDTDDVCTCTELTADCTCKIALPLKSDTKTHGCNGGWVGQLGMPAMANIVNGWARFGGFDNALNNGGHLGTYVIDGTFAGGWLHKLKLTMAFNIDPSFDSVPVDTKWGLVTYGDCAAGYSFGYYIYKKADGTIWLVAVLELQDENGVLTAHKMEVEVNTGTEYYVVFIYCEDNDPSWVLYLMSFADFISCTQGVSSACPTAADITSNPNGTLTPRGCGFVVGHSGTDVNGEFFVGDICMVSVDVAPDCDLDNLWPCS